MRIVVNDKLKRLVTMDDVGVRLFDISGSEAREIATAPLPQGRWLACCRSYVAVLSGKLAPAHSSIVDARLTRFSWQLAPLGVTALGEVEKRGVSLSADGSRLATTDWKECRVLLKDAASGRRIAGNGEGIPSGAAISPDGARIIAGSADQGSGAILLFDARAAGDSLPMETLPEHKVSPGLDDAPYFSVFSPSGRLAAVSNESWGGRGVFLFDVERKAPLWSAVFDSSAEEPEEWYPFAIAFTADERLLLVRHPAALQAYRVRDGADLGSIPLDGVGFHGFAIEDSAQRAWVTGKSPRAHRFPPAWVAALTEPAEPAAAGKPAAAKPTDKPATKPADKPTAAKPGAEKPRTEEPAPRAKEPAAKPRAEEPAAKEPAKKSAAKGKAAKAAKAPTAKPDAKAPAAKKAAPKKPAAKAPAAKKPAKTPAKTPEKAPAAKKPAAKKPAAKKRA